MVSEMFNKGVRLFVDKFIGKFALIVQKIH